MQAQRLLKEYRDHKKERAKEGKDNIHLFPLQNDITKWIAIIQGPPDCPYEGGHFAVRFEVPSSYPLQPPKARFETKIFHANIHPKTGEVCLDILKTAWSPAWTLQSVCRAIVALLASPEPDSPLNCDAGNLLRMNDDRGHNSMAKMYTALYATSAQIEAVRAKEGS
uniref:UBC core domain-containing protein n=1 Tax=Palpitomonas bilix TaxID=652834 RepID=A0A7S3D2U1_9EUKA|mmetsp:Transcript_19653/g.50338  ORF Transcript_19653/g.50338 Transcript_19653/m.50338 type:complete len:167 (+) Transcript_19653:251-751(+)|eukprot:CAMPEP_0113894782 /NCGR_PEP_ID=MMETSP0780_2-20120614/16946_1 /TAXON_ID=652834 /ORGANISM="Palpitomonas bilix" /LENGTH=166 /DNA_ID=CAMNT_0000885435 /DNA_START=251 /DNA_END=751 /DNA_ORIENTATION=+ /assembly_acc=CAM_ASM_000599